MMLSLQAEIERLTHLNKALNAERIEFFTANHLLEVENDALRAENKNLNAWQQAHKTELLKSPSLGDDPYWRQS